MAGVDGGRLVIQTDELREALELFADWAGRMHELPNPLREELQALASAPSESLADVRVIRGLVCEVVLAPRLRALVGNLRARAVCRA